MKKIIKQKKKWNARKKNEKEKEKRKEERKKKKIEKEEREKGEKRKDKEAVENERNFISYVNQGILSNKTSKNQIMNPINNFKQSTDNLQRHNKEKMLHPKTQLQRNS